MMMFQRLSSQVNKISIQGRAKNLAKFRADGLRIGSPRLVGGRKAGISNMQEFFCTKLCTGSLWPEIFFVRMQLVLCSHVFQSYRQCSGESEGGKEEWRERGNDLSFRVVDRGKKKVWRYQGYNHQDDAEALTQFDIILPQDYSKPASQRISLGSLRLKKSEIYTLIQKVVLYVKRGPKLCIKFV